MARGDEAGLGLGSARSARKRADSGGQPDEIEPLPLEGVGRVGQPIVDRTLGAALKRDFDELYQLALPVALKDEDLAKGLTDVRNTLYRFIRRCRLRRYRNFLWRIAIKSPVFNAQSHEAEDLRSLLQTMQQLRLQLSMLTAGAG